jgi:hypothetical protein
VSEREDARGEAAGGTARPGPAPPPATAQEALARSGRHARAALCESLRALEALLDAASLAASGELAATRRVLGPLARSLAAAADDLEGASRDGSLSLLAAVAEALDAEIARWELRAREDPDARAVLRAFLGLRELLWEFGVRRAEGGEPAAASGVRPRRAPARRARLRVQRVPVEG